MAKKQDTVKLPTELYAAISRTQIGDPGFVIRSSSEAEVLPCPEHADATGRLIGVYELVRTYVARVEVVRSDDTPAD